VKVGVSEHVMHGAYSIVTTRQVRWACYIRGERMPRAGLFRTQREATEFLLHVVV